MSRSNSALLFVIASPVGPYYKSGFDAVKLYANTKYVRAWPGGTGDAKVGGYVLSSVCGSHGRRACRGASGSGASGSGARGKGLLTASRRVLQRRHGAPRARLSNYAPGIKPQAVAAELGYAQNLWLFGPNHEVTEVGTMNFFCLWVNEQGGTPLQRMHLHTHLSHGGWSPRRHRLRRRGAAVRAGGRGTVRQSASL